MILTFTANHHEQQISEKTHDLLYTFLILAIDISQRLIWNISAERQDKGAFIKRKIYVTFKLIINLREHLIKHWKPVKKKTDVRSLFLPGSIWSMAPSIWLTIAVLSLSVDPNLSLEPIPQIIFPWCIRVGKALFCTIIVPWFTHIRQRT